MLRHGKHYDLLVHKIEEAPKAGPKRRITGKTEKAALLRSPDVALEDFVC